MRSGQKFNLVIVGAGPGGLAPLLAAHRHGRLNQMLAKGVAIVERSDRFGNGAIGTYGINSDSSGDTFFDCLRGDEETELTALRDHPLAREMAAAGNGPVALQRAGLFMELVGAALRRMIERHPACVVLTRHNAAFLQRTADGWKTAVDDFAGHRTFLYSRNIVSATGAHQPLSRLADERVGGVSLLERCGDRLVQSGDVFTIGGLQKVDDRLAGLAAPRVAIVGGSTSAAAVAHALLHRLPTVRFADGSITLLHRRELRIYYPSVAEALAENYTEFGEDDICPISKRVFRLAGFRLDSRELMMRARGIGGRPPEPRLKLHRLQPRDPEAIAIIDQADLVVAALGYRPHAMRVVDRAGADIALHSDLSPKSPLVDGQCRILDASGAPIPGLFGMGLAAGFVPRGALGGEPSFVGQANGLWLWQNDVGLLIVDAVLAEARRAGRSPLKSPAWEIQHAPGDAVPLYGETTGVGSADVAFVHAGQGD